MLEANWKIECWVWNVQFSVRQSRDPSPHTPRPHICKCVMVVMVKISASSGEIAGRGRVLVSDLFCCHCAGWPGVTGVTRLCGCGIAGMWGQAGAEKKSLKRSKIQSNRRCIHNQTHRAVRVKPHEHQECLPISDFYIYTWLVYLTQCFLYLHSTFYIM